ncbi:hypothetical protein SAMN05660479_02921 [Microbulbifer thermotolerans]|nr:hypothetical protein SAMN05660479_02921 [Microbulbifer thermotolerans]
MENCGYIQQSFTKYTSQLALKPQRNESGFILSKDGSPKLFVLQKNLKSRCYCQTACFMQITSVTA